MLVACWLGRAVKWLFFWTARYTVRMKKQAISNEEREAIYEAMLDAIAGADHISPLERNDD